MIDTKSGLHLCPGCCEKRIPVQRDLCYLCEALERPDSGTRWKCIHCDARGMNDEQAKAHECGGCNLALDPPDPSVELSPSARKRAKIFGAVFFALLVSSPWWMRFVYELSTGKIQ